MATKEKTRKHYTLDEVVGDLSAERRARIDALKEETRSEIVAYNLAELRRARQITQTELARRLDRAQATVSKIEHTNDHLVSTVRSVVESLGGHLELVAVFDDDRIPILTPETNP